MTHGKPRMATWDHVIPLSRQGPDVAGNKLVVCQPCNCDKGSMTLAEWLGALYATEDARARCVGWLLEHIMEAMSQAECAALYAESGVGYATAVNLRRRPRLVAGTDVDGEPVPKLIKAAALRTAAHNMLSALGVPATHWSFLPPDRVRVLIGSLQEDFTVDAGLPERVLAHPRAKFLERRA